MSAPAAASSASPASSPTSTPRAFHPLTALIVAIVPLASFLAFIVQPLMGKRLLPIYGGSAATWLGSMLFFQLSLLLGYAWAAWLVGRPLRRQILATCCLAVLAILTFHLPSGDASDHVGIAGIVGRLMLSCLPAMVLLFSISPLMHAWLRRRGEEIPYYLYAVSNTGSLLALFAYPFLIETNLRTSTQSYYWHGLLVIVAGLIAAVGWILHRKPDSAHAAPSDEFPLSNLKSEISDSLPIATLWLGLSALTCIGMLGATFHLSAEMGSNPLAWVGPFGVYLLSFTVTFTGHWRPWMTRVTLGWLAVSLTGYMLVKGFTAATVNGHAAFWLLSLTAAGSFLGNALLHSLRPARRFERYYLFLAAGGVLGGLVSALLVPALFPRPAEFVLASIALLVIGLLWLTGRRDPATIAVVALVVAAPVLGIGLQQIAREAGPGDHYRHSRNLYAHLIVKTDDHSVVLSSDTTTHGSQITTSPETRRRPTLYYTESTGVGRAIQRLQAAHPSVHVGVIGLGAGTLAAYARAEDTFEFWDIDPAVIRVAHDDFSFLNDSPGKILVHQLDGRRGIATSTAPFDLIVIDAFSGDGIPAHLITQEALKLYTDHLVPADGLIAVHASSRYSKLLPVVATTSRLLGLTTLGVDTTITEPGREIDWDPTFTQYIIVGRPSQIDQAATWFAAEEDGGRVTHTLTFDHSTQLFMDRIWTDERHATLDAFDLGRFLFE